MKFKMRRLSLAGAGAFALVAVLLLVPVSYEMGIGSVVRADWEAPAGDAVAAAASAAIAAEVAGLDRLVEYKLNREGDRMCLAAAFSDVDPDEAAARIKETILRHADTGSTSADTTAGALAKPRIGEISVATGAIVRMIRANALAAATGGIVRIHVRGASPEELGQALMAELEAQGFSGSVVDVTTESVGDSLRVTHVEVQTGTPPEGTSGDSTEIELIITQEGE